ncbi:MAG: TonB-dependent receptor [Rubrivivax sp.]|nr:TonB-dependent receptor [Rubrivivax sp.]
MYDIQDGLLASARPRGQRAISLRTNPCTTGPSSIVTTQPGRTPQNDGRVNPDVPFQTCVPTAATDGIPNSVYIENDRNFTMLAGGLLFPATGGFNLPDNRLRGFGPSQTTYLRFAPDGSLVPYNPGINFGNTNASGGDGFTLQDTTQITSKVERHTVNVLGNLQVAPWANLFYEGLFYRAEALELVDQTAYNSNLFGGASAPVTFAASHPMLSPSAVATLQANGITNFRLSRVNRDLAVNNGRGTTDVARSVVGVNGSFEVADRVFNWEVSANFGKNDSVFFTNALNQQRFVNALNVTRDAQGNVVCTTTPTPGLVVPNAAGSTIVPVADPNCVPLNLFGEGVLSPDAKAYVSGTTTTKSVLEQTVFNANIGGTLFNLWAGPVDANFGVEQRKESGEFIPDDFQVRGLGRAVPILGNAGEYTTKEVFGEVVVPLIAPAMKLPLLDKLVLTGKFRRVDSTVNGVADTYTYGFQFRPVRDIELRGNATRALRSPALVELFTPSSNIFTTVPDPCDSRNVNSGTNPALRRANCQPFYTQFGLDPSTFLSTAVTATIPGTLSGSPTLRNEKSDAINVGLIFRPRAVKNLQMSWDYFKIDIADTISNLNATAIATGCYDNPDPSNPFCGRITRDATGQITGISTGFVNGGILEFRGHAAEVQYSFDLDDVSDKLGGEFTVGVSVSNLGTLKTSTNRVVTTDQAGELGSSKDVSQVSFGYRHKGATLTLRGNYIGGATFSNTESAETRDIRFIPRYTLWSGSVGYDFNKKLRMNLAVTNLLNREPPFPLTAGAASGIYDTLGRRFSLTVRYAL